ncbi:MAG: class II aldolase/adducin family protein [Actinomycetota bacterium]
MTDFENAREPVAAVARMVSRAGLVEAFGHVSMRTTEGFAITGVGPLHRTRPGDVILADPTGRAIGGPVDTAPLETPMHAAIYSARPDVGSVCRGHPPYAVAWGVGTEDLPLLHGLGALAGDRIPVHDDIELITEADQAAQVAGSLGAGSSLILRANGALSVGGDPVEAATRLFYLEERARVASTSVPAAEAGVGAWERRRRHTAPELVRARAWFEARFGDDRTG